MENEKNKKYNAARLTADPDISIEDPKFDFDDLQDEACDLLLPKMTRCHGDDSESVSYLTCCNCGFEECEYYGYRYKSSTYCNECASEVCGKLIEKPKFAFNPLPIEEEIDHNEFFQCQGCFYETKWEDNVCIDDQWFCNGCAHDSELLNQYSVEQREQLRLYAEKHSITIEESIDYQTHCHCCGKTVDDGVFDEMNHQYCNEKCFEHCEDYWYECFRGEECKVCEIWEYRARRDSLTAHDIELSDCEPVLNAIDCFKELNVYPQLYECIEDLVDYFDSDRQWRYDYV
jgi:hypothetical protein